MPKHVSDIMSVNVDNFSFVMYNCTFIYKAHVYFRALKMLHETTKRKVEAEFTAEYMSSEESVMEDTEGHASESSSENDEDSILDQQKSHKRLIKDTLSWRSKNFSR